MRHEESSFRQRELRLHRSLPEYSGARNYLYAGVGTTEITVAHVCVDFSFGRSIRLKGFAADFLVKGSNASRSSKKK